MNTLRRGKKKKDNTHYIDHKMKTVVNSSTSTSPYRHHRQGTEGYRVEVVGR